MHNARSFSEDVCDKIGYYVYLLLDPDSRVPFYIGKGKANRVFHHLKDQSSSEKCRRIRELHELGKEPILEILKYGLTESEALLVEATAIDLIGLNNLSNVVRGHGSRHGMRASVEDIELELSSRGQRVEFDDPGLLIKISRLYNYSMSAIELYDSTRSCWVLSEERARKAKYAFAVYDSIIREVYEITGWLPGGSTMVCYERGEVDGFRREFVGKIASSDIRKKYFGKDVSAYFQRGAANPIQYVGGA
jgi:hypothetical protein